MIVTQRELDEELERVCAEVEHPEQGLFGPSSVTWRIGRDSAVFLGAGRAALLQLAHPYVAHAVDQHSATRTDPIGRFNRTFLHVYGMIFGDLDAAVTSARRVRGVHDGIHGPIDEDVGPFARGHRYTAHDGGAILWVFATLVESSLMGFELAFGALEAADREGYYQELSRFARLFGLSRAALPATFADFEVYCARMYEGPVLSVGRPAREIAGFLLSAQGAPLAPAMRWYETLTAGMLPPRLRAEYGLPFSHADEVVYQRMTRLIRRAWPHLPERVRLRPEYVEAMHRLAGKPRADRVGRALQQALLRGLRPAGPRATGS
jgi:uncharacterized protein (DUF2236 family)